MILWISSYPKSGNTWVRALIATYLYSKEGKFNFDLIHKIPKFTQKKYFSTLAKLEELREDPLKITKYWDAAQSRINLLDNHVKFFKTHNACISYKNRWFTDETNTIGYIYIVRDPRAVACSNAYHSDISFERSVSVLLNENEIGYNGSYKLAEIPGPWKINYQSWKKKKKFNGIVVKYEDLIDDTKREFTNILIFLKKIIDIDIDEKKILKSIKSCSFSKLSKMENQYGFEETSNNKFFRKGTKDSWKNDLSQDLRKKIEENFKDEMIELGYL